ncbi:LAQU0S01e08042g1_1 [Lachancea quebecensis]|uniref:Chromatin modification-related protein n=1 Tax=Lachancea quebecensis TaxID=1654605 RepID=A0A0N7MKV1_9SACH|nr:LAQU0S01e08042g1_1 [Lachancea quebecensis]
MAAPANLYPGINDISDVLEEMPLEVTRYLTLLREIDAKCVHTVPELNSTIGEFLGARSSECDGAEPLGRINGLFQDLMPSLEEKMHVSALAYEALNRLTARLELAYEVAIKNNEIPPKLRLGNDNHPAMHLHHELMAKIDSKSSSKSSQALKSESRREAMAARRTAGAPPGASAGHATGSVNAGGVGGVGTGGFGAGAATTGTAAAATAASTTQTTDGRKRRAMAGPTGAVSGAIGTAAGGASADSKKRKRKTASREDYSQRPKTNEYGEALYCYCNQVAYGEMVGCDGDNCILEWFHLPCIGLETLPKGKWYCDDCKRAL